MWANTLWPFSSSTRNIAFGRGASTVPSRTIASSLGLASFVLLGVFVWRAPGVVHRRVRPQKGAQGRGAMLGAGTANVQLDAPRRHRRLQRGQRSPSETPGARTRQLGGGGSEAATPDPPAPIR